MMQYDGELKLPKYFLVPPPHIDKPTGQYASANGISTYAVSESQKIGHVTFFWNGNRSGYFNKDLEEYHEVSLSISLALHAHACLQTGQNAIPCTFLLLQPCSMQACHSRTSQHCLLQG